MLSRPTPRALAALSALLLAIGLPLLPGPRPAVGGDRLPDAVRPTWTRYESPLAPTWPDQPRFTSDAAPKPVAAGDLVLFPSSRHDCVVAADAATGDTRWRFVADGPIRFAPAVWRDRAFVVSDDGKLYCLALEDGSVLWSVRGGPSDQLVLGNERLINVWPARGAPDVAEDGDEVTVYFGAGIWPFMGIFLHAVDARTGEIRWTNSGDGSTYIKQPHQADAFAGVAPQGEFAVHGDRLLVPGGRSVPACYDRHTGRRLHYRLADGSKTGGGPDVVAAADVYVNGGGAFHMETGKPLGPISEPVAASGEWLFSVQAGVCRAFDVTERPPVDEKKEKEKKEKEKDKTKPKAPPEAWLGRAASALVVPPTLTLLAAGGRVYGGGNGQVYAIEGLIEGRPRIAWQATFRGTAAHLAYREGTLFVGTREGAVHAFGPGSAQGALPRRVTPLPSTAEDAARTDRLLTATGAKAGYAVLSGFDAGAVAALLAKSALRLIVLEPDPEKRDDLRTALRRADIDGKRAAVLPVTPGEALLPPYLCTLLAIDGPLDDAARTRLFNAVRPYGGVMAVREGDGWVVKRRDGALPGSGNWSHENVDAANTRVAADTLVKAPLGVLWYGGPGNQDILPRHGHGPVPQVVDGRCIIEGMDQLRAIDIYTGRLLWTASLPGLGQLYDNTAHQAGANGIGSNYVSTPEGVFVALGRECLRLDPETGKVVQRYSLLPMPGEKVTPRWSFLTVVGPYLIGASSPTPRPGAKVKKGEFTGLEASRRVAVLDRDSGKLLWTVAAQHGIRHHGICAGGGRLYLLDRKQEDASKVSRDGKKSVIVGSVAAYDLKTGNRAWRVDRGTFGTFLSYSAKHDVLVESGLMTRDTLKDEARGMRAFAAAGGKVLWTQPDYFGPAIIHGDRVLKGGDVAGASGTACEILTGKPIKTPDPITGQPAEWKWQRTYGCNTPAASEHLMLFRSGAAGFYDLCGDGGTGNLGGFRSSCTLNLIPAGGVLVAPDYTRTCTCSYQNQTSLALVHWPDAELWTFTTSRAVSGPVRRLGVNLGAPGGRKASDGTLWLEYPPAGGPSPKVAIASTPAAPETFRMHAAEVGGEKPWVTCSGLKGVQELKIPLDAADRPKAYTVRLHFLEPERQPAGKRVFDVLVQGKPALEGLDVSQEAGGPGRPLVRELRGVRVGKELVLTFRGPAVLSGVEVVAEGW